MVTVKLSWDLKKIKLKKRSKLMTALIWGFAGFFHLMQIPHETSREHTEYNIPLKTYTACPFDEMGVLLHVRYGP